MTEPKAQKKSFNVANKKRLSTALLALMLHYTVNTTILETRHNNLTS